MTRPSAAQRTPPIRSPGSSKAPDYLEVHMPIGEWDLDLPRTRQGTVRCRSLPVVRHRLGCIVDVQGHTIHEAANGAQWWTDNAGCWRHDSDLLELNMAGA